MWTPSVARDAWLGLGGLLISTSIVLAAVAVIARLAEHRLMRGTAPRAEEPVSPVAAPADATRKGLARLCSVLALVCLAGGSTLLAVGTIAISVAAQDDPNAGLGLAVIIAVIWPATFVLTWAFGTAAFAAKGTLDPAAAVLAFPGLLVGLTVLILLAARSLGETPAAPLAAFVGVLAVLNAATIYFVWRKFWASRRPSASAAGP
jgi:hypothetical protein